VSIDIVDESGLERRIANAEFSVGTSGIGCRLVDDRNLTQES
jgi:hypothetical protein